MQKNGFTLIELVVVMALLGIMLALTAPKIQNSMLTDQSRKLSLWLSIKIKSMKQKSLRESQKYILYFNIDHNSIWEAGADISPEEIDAGEESAYQLPEGFELIDLEYPEDKITSGRALIYFHTAGYCDKVLIHIRDDKGADLTFEVEPFLAVNRLDEYLEFE